MLRQECKVWIACHFGWYDSIDILFRELDGRQIEINKHEELHETTTHSYHSKSASKLGRENIPTSSCVKSLYKEIDCTGSEVDIK